MLVGAKTLKPVVIEGNHEPPLEDLRSKLDQRDKSVQSGTLLLGARSL